MNEQNLNEFIKIVVSYSFDANKYFNDTEPWKFKKTDAKRMNTILFTIFGSKIDRARWTKNINNRLSSISERGNFFISP